MSDDARNSRKSGTVMPGVVVEVTDSVAQGAQGAVWVAPEGMSIKDLLCYLAFIVQ